MLELLLMVAGAGQDRLRSQPIRQRLLDLIEKHPGRHASELCRTAGGPWSTVQYHLDLLARGDMVTAVDAGRTKRFFPREVDERTARLLAMFHEGRRVDVARLIQQQPGLRQVDLCLQVDVSRKTFRNAIAPLVREGLVQERRGLQDNRYFPGEGLNHLLDAADDELA